MNETSKAAQRRYHDGAFHQHYFVGHGIDIGAGSDSLSQYIKNFSRIASVQSWDIQNGHAQEMASVANDTFDFVHSSHCLEHLENPFTALHHWLRILKPGGYLIVTVPDEDLYEHGQWPSSFNPHHKWSFTLYKPQRLLPKSINLIDMLREFSSQVECERMVLIRNFYDESVPNNQDQTLGHAECAIEFIWRKRGNSSQIDLITQGCKAEQQENDAQAEAIYRSALTDPHLALNAYNNLAHLLTRLQRYDEVEELWQQASEAMPQEHLPRISRALFLLQRGKFREGFRWRESCVPDARRTPYPPIVNYPRWQGENISRGSIVIWTEFGFGDEIMFSRYASILKSRLNAARVSILCQDALYPILKSTLSTDLVLPVSRKEEMPVHDYWVFPHSIPVYLPINAESIGIDIPYLQPSSKSRLVWKRQLNLNDENLKVGLAWRGNPTHENDDNRSLKSLSVLEELLAMKDILFVSIQKGQGEEEAQDRAKNQSNFHAWGHKLTDFGNTAALISNLDMVITVDTAVAHLAGAMGIPVWLMLPTVSDWRWLLEREDCIWYPSMRIFRQKRLGKWQEVIHAIAIALSKLKLSNS